MAMPGVGFLVGVFLFHPGMVRIGLVRIEFDFAPFAQVDFYMAGKHGPDLPFAGLEPEVTPRLPVVVNLNVGIVMVHMLAAVTMGRSVRGRTFFCRWGTILGRAAMRVGQSLA